jgi:predicted small metal-binding protein
MARKVARCFCGFVTAGEDDELVEALQKHGREDHKEEVSREDALAMAEPEGEATS